MYSYLSRRPAAPRKIQSVALAHEVCFECVFLIPVSMRTKHYHARVCLLYATDGRMDEMNGLQHTEAESKQKQTLVSQAYDVDDYQYQDAFREVGELASAALSADFESASGLPRALPRDCRNAKVRRQTMKMRKLKTWKSSQTLFAAVNQGSERWNWSSGRTSTGGIPRITHLYRPMVKKCSILKISSCPPFLFLTSLR